MSLASRLALPAEADRVVVAVNPRAAARSVGARVGRLVELLEGAGFQAEVGADLPTVVEKAAAWHARGRLRALIGVGGDGTAAELVNRTPAGLPWTMLAAGNENLFCRHLRLGRSPEGVCRTVAAGAVVRLDAGRANGRIFLLMASCGFDAEVVRRLHARRTGPVRNRHYLKPILESIRSYRYAQLRLEWQDREAGPVELALPPDRAGWVFAFNLPCYGGGFRIAPQADGCDGLLDVCAFRRGSLWHGLRYAAAILAGRHQRMADCLVRRTRRLRVSSEAEVPYQLDGDPGGSLPLEIEVLPGRLTVVVPEPEAARRRALRGR